MKASKECYVDEDEKVIQERHDNDGRSHRVMRICPVESYYLLTVEEREKDHILSRIVQFMDMHDEINVNNKKLYYGIKEFLRIKVNATNSATLDEMRESYMKENRTDSFADYCSGRNPMLSQLIEKSISFMKEPTEKIMKGAKLEEEVRKFINKYLKKMVKSLGIDLILMSQEEYDQLSQDTQIDIVSHYENNIPNDFEPCKYCGSYKGVLKCQCGECFCNGKIEGSPDCHLVHHILVKEHYKLSWNDEEIRCEACTCSDIYSMFYYKDVNNEYHFICRNCGKKMENIIPFIDEGQISFDGIGQSKGTVNVSALPKPINETREVCLQTKNVYDSDEVYIDTYIKLLRANSKSAKDITEVRVHTEEIKDKLVYRKENGSEYVKFIKKNRNNALEKDDDIVLVFEGAKAMIRDENVDSYKDDIKETFEDCKAVVFGSCHSFNHDQIEMKVTEVVPVKTGEKKVKRLLENCRYATVYIITNQMTNKQYEDSIKTFREYDSRMKRYILGNVPPLINKVEITNIQGLNPSQMKAVKMVEEHEVSLIVGPPGCGKSKTCVEIAKYMLKKHKEVLINDELVKLRVLITASSNKAVNVIAERLVDDGINIVRVCANNQYQELSDKLRENSLFYKAYNHLKKYEKGSKDYGSLKDAFEKVINSFLSNDEKKMIDYVTDLYHGDPQSKETSNLSTFIATKYPEVKKLIDKRDVSIPDVDKKKCYSYIKSHYNDIVEDCDCVCSTLSYCLSDKVSQFKYSCVIVDEAAQSVEPETLIAFKNHPRVVLVGDIQQLQPFIKNEEAKRKGFNIPMFTRLLECNYPSTLLDTQYRMHPAISEFANVVFYNRKLRDGVGIMDREDIRMKGFFNDDKFPCMFVQCKAKEYISGHGQSVANESEKDVIRFFLKELKDKGIKDEEIGVISPYSLQRDILLEMTSTIEVANIDGYQGNEKDYIIFSCVRANLTRGVGFLNEYQRINVALTRARRGLIVIGNYETLRRSPALLLFINYCQKHKSIKSFNLNTKKLVNYSLDDEMDEMESDFNYNYEQNDKQEEFDQEYHDMLEESENNAKAERKRRYQEAKSYFKRPNTTKAEQENGGDNNTTQNDENNTNENTAEPNQDNPIENSPSNVDLEENFI